MMSLSPEHVTHDLLDGLRVFPFFHITTDPNSSIQEHVLLGM